MTSIYTTSTFYSSFRTPLISSGILLFNLSAFAQTDITTDITTNTTWDLSGSPYIVQGDIEVSSGSAPVLTVKAGVEVRFTSGSSLRIGDQTYSNLTCHIL